MVPVAVKSAFLAAFRDWKKTADVISSKLNMTCLNTFVTSAAKIIMLTVPGRLKKKKYSSPTFHNLTFVW